MDSHDAYINWGPDYSERNPTEQSEGADQPLLSDVSNLDKTFLGADIHNIIAGLFYATMWERSEKQAAYLRWKNKPWVVKSALLLFKDIQEENFTMDIYECSTKMVAYIEILEALNLNKKPLINKKDE